MSYGAIKAESDNLDFGVCHCVSGPDELRSYCANSPFPSQGI